ncbi:GAF domain-containing sensor histidine kinase [Bradyrhizobium sp. 197]|jgi:signal transduction histidine kinase|uniref:GAF domain-containing sensor histidine kinase n=1 Tax=Bradyrhizobium sp. 197 TaxID=2782663 RepID=UPI001FF9BCF3|nr:GAF domain-containing sensor histidine kinase [Bradyrhizobium sp. 197]MCK1474573.1 GAF domain-containing sensor histidine kinase [Bradyrhizobium sp. 197]
MDFERDIAKVSGIAAVSTILDVVSRTTGMGFTAVARVTEDRWITCASRDELAFGLKPGDELKVETTICHEIRQSREAVVIENVSEDAGYFKHHTPAQYGFQSYISVPIILPDGSFFGTLCAIDPKPRKLRTPEVIGMFKLFAELIASHLDAGDRVELIENRLALERQNAELREQFIAVLGHDLRNPLAAIQGGLRLLNKKVDEEGQNWINLLQGSVARMAALIDNVMDLARTRLGAGMQLELREQALGPVIKQIVAEFENVHPDRVIETVINIPGTVRIDAGRIGQMLSNLLGNAISYGAANEPIRVLAQTTGAGFDISIVNKGAPIPAEAMPRLFTAFDRGDVLPNQKGLGLGLYIAQEIARAHGGLIVASSLRDETVFTASFPATQASG